MFLGLLGPDPDRDPSIIKKEIARKTLIPSVLLLFYDVLSLKNDVNVPSKSRKSLQKLLIFLLAP
jgi:hypothetical protein